MSTASTHRTVAAATNEPGWMPMLRPDPGDLDVLAAACDGTKFSGPVRLFRSSVSR